MFATITVTLALAFNSNVITYKPKSIILQIFRQPKESRIQNFVLTDQPETQANTSCVSDIEVLSSVVPTCSIKPPRHTKLSTLLAWNFDWLGYTAKDGYVTHV